jgi:hypothetical protein
MQILLLRKISIVLFHQELQLNLELFTLQFRKKRKQNKSPEKINCELTGCQDSKDFYKDSRGAMSGNRLKSYLALCSSPTC